jgi:mono/diheme cytochrome c family protein
MPLARAARAARVLLGALVALIACCALVGTVLWLDRLPAGDAVRSASDSAAVPTPAGSADPARVDRGAYLVRIAHCAGCHTARGGAPLAGGRALATPFGVVYAGNLTPDEATGLGAWSADDFWRALHHGRGRDGRRMVPAFPYTETTRITRADSDAMWAWLRTLPPVHAPARPHELRGLYGTQLALAAWRVLFFRPGVWQDDPARGTEWNRGAYLVNGAGHCAACHGGRNLLGAAGDGFAGGFLPTGEGYAPSLARPDQAGVQDWPIAEVMALLREGAAPRGRATGAMAAVVRGSTAHLDDADLRAVAVYLHSLPREQPPARRRIARDDPARDLARDRAARGERLYADHCAACHGSTGEGGATPDGRLAIPALAGQRAVTLDPPVNLVRSIAHGGFGIASAREPRPWGMPPFAHVLGDDDIAALATFLRQAWGADAAPVSATEVARWRGRAID